LEPFSNPLTTTSLGIIVLMLASANVAQWKEIKRLNAARLRDLKEISDKERKVIDGITKAMNNLRHKIDGLGGGRG
jgi:hypothetical protein